ncbi:MAG: hypothetical protein HRU29_14750 [Rhizobiales bacterium]|nr:hypothetical protein [Hyphomicrobiales bacterium]NRB15655.1 hypothetical protein [Hyphomicrobiales bacterium]
MSKEKDLYNHALTIMVKHGGFITTKQLIEELEALFQPTGHDAKILGGRNDSHFSQIVRNIVSHKKEEGNIIHSGLAEHDIKRHGLLITDAGREHLKLIR